MSFTEKLAKAIGKNKSLLCVGLDPDPKSIPENLSVLDFNKAIIDATADLACTYKLNIAFYEAMGTEGIDTLKKSLEYIPDGILKFSNTKVRTKSARIKATRMAS